MTRLLCSDRCPDAVFALVILLATLAGVAAFGVTLYAVLEAIR